MNPSTMPSRSRRVRSHWSSCPAMNLSRMIFFTRSRSSLGELVADAPRRGLDGIGKHDDRVLPRLRHRSGIPEVLFLHLFVRVLFQRLFIKNETALVPWCCGITSCITRGSLCFRASSRPSFTCASIISALMFGDNLLCRCLSTCKHVFNEIVGLSILPISW